MFQFTFRSVFTLDHFLSPSLTLILNIFKKTVIVQMLRAKFNLNESIHDF